MQSVNEQLENYRKKGRRHRVWKNIVTTLASVVVFCTVYALILPAITLEGESFCGKEEHEHGDGCYSEAVTTVEERLICLLDEVEPHTHSDECYEIQQEEVIIEETVEVPVEVPVETAESSDEETEPETITVMETQTVTRTEIVEKEVLICDKEETEGHAHGEGCYEEIEVTSEPEFICTLDEHTHEKMCYSDPNADVETRAQWEETFENVTFTNDWVTDTIAIAKTQLGYTESVKNYEVAENGDVKGYTRYGDWYGNCYGDWCAMFVSFCLDYAKVDDFPQEAGCQNWIGKIKNLETSEYNAWQEATEEYIPEKGNIIFFNWDSEADSDHVGIVVDVKVDAAGSAKITTIEGNASDTVKYKEYDHTNGTIMGYGILPDQGYYCEAEGHAHDADCYNNSDELICKMEVHIHSAECKVKPQDEVIEDENADDEVIEDENADDEVIEDEIIEDTPVQDEVPENITAMIEAIAALPSSEEAKELEDTKDVEAKALAVYVAFEELSVEEKAQITNKDKLLELTWLWENKSSYTDQGIDVFQVNAYDSEAAPAETILFYGKSADEYGFTQMKFSQWTAIIVEGVKE